MVPGHGGSWSTVDLRVGRRILGGVTARVEAANLLDRERTELHGVPLPDRWVSVVLTRREEER